MMVKHMVTPVGVVALVPMMAHADVFDWSLADEVRSGHLGTTKGGDVTFRSGHVDHGEHLEVAVELTWRSQDKKRSHSQIVIQEMADAHPLVTMEGGLVDVTTVNVPWGDEKPVSVSRCWAYESSGTRFVEVPCP